MNCKCGVELSSINWYQSDKKAYNYICKKCRGIQSKIWVNNNVQRYALMTKKHRNKLKNEVLSKYSSNDKPECRKCGYSDIRALSLDHINGQGFKDREIGLFSHGLYRKLKKEHFPEGYQTLCMNCQMIKKIENGEVRKGGIMDKLRKLDKLKKDLYK